MQPVNYECSEMLKVLDYYLQIPSLPLLSVLDLFLLAQTLKCKFHATCNLLSIGGSLGLQFQKCTK